MSLALMPVLTRDDVERPLHNHQPPPLPAAAADKIEAVVAEADKALA